MTEDDAVRIAANFLRAQPDLDLAGILMEEAEAGFISCNDSLESPTTGDKSDAPRCAEFRSHWTVYFPFDLPEGVASSPGGVDVTVDDETGKAELFDSL